MSKILRKITVTAGAVAVSVGLLGALSATPANAATSQAAPSRTDSSWGY